MSARGACSVEIARDFTRVGAVSKLLGGGHDRHRAQHWRGVGVWLCAVDLSSGRIKAVKGTASWIAFAWPTRAANQ